MVEMTLKLTGLGCSNYWADGWIQARTRTRTLNPRPHSYPNPNPNSNPHHNSLTLTLALALTLTLTPTPTLTRWNKLDGTIVILSAFDMGLTILLSGGGVNLSFLRILRMLRMLRMLRLMKSWKALYKICLALARAMPQMSNMIILLFLVMMIFSLLGAPCHAPTYSPKPNLLP